MNPDFKVLTNVNPSNLKSPVIQNRFRKLTLQSPKEDVTKTKSPGRRDNLGPKHTLGESLNPIGAANNKSHMDTITNKLMLSTSSSDTNEQRTLFINVETEPSRPLQILNTEKENESPNCEGNSKNNDLVTKMGMLEVSQRSIDMFSQNTQSTQLSKFSMPQNRVVEKDDNIENISQRISSIHVSNELLGANRNNQSNTMRQGLAEGHLRESVGEIEPNVSQRFNNQLYQSLAETQPNTPGKFESRPNTSPILIASDSEDGDDGVKNINKSLMTEETEDSEADESVIEIESSDDNNEDGLPEMAEENARNVESSEMLLEQPSLQMPQVNAGNMEAGELLEQKMKRYFDNLPKFDSILSHNTSDNNSAEISTVLTDINVPETSVSNNGNDSIQHEARRSNESLEKSHNNNKSSSLETDSEAEAHQATDNNKNDTFDSHLDKNNELLPMEPSHSSVNESDKTAKTDNISDHQTSQIEENSDNTSKSLHLNDSPDKSECSNVEAPKTFSSEVIKKNGSSVFTINSPRINITAKININIQLSVSASSSEEDSSSEIANSSCSKEESKNDTTTEEEAHLSRHAEYVIQYEKAETDGRIGDPHLNKIYINSPSKHKENEQIDAIHESSVEISRGPISNKSFSIHTENGCAEEVPEIENSRRSICDSIAAIDPARDSLVVSTTPMDISGEIDEVGEKLLDEVYGVAWRTPQLIKKCLSTRKKCLTDVNGRNRSRGFSLFQRYVPSELESTRIGPALLDEEDNIGKRLDDSPQTLRDSPAKLSTGENIEDNGNQSSRIIRTCRKVPANRIVDSSSDESESDRDESFEPSISDQSESESDCSSETIDVPKPTSRKKNEMMYLDLTCIEVIEDEDHYKPDASAEDLEEVSKKFIQSIETSTTVQTPAPTKKSVPSIPAKRKLFTPNYDDLPPFEERETPIHTPKNIKEKIVKLKTPIPTFLIPPKFREKQLTTINGVREPTTPLSVRSIDRNQVPTTPVSTRICGFLESLDDKKIPDKFCDPDALIFRINFKNNRHVLVKRLMKLFDDKVFANKLKDVPVSWSKTLTKTAGICKTRKIGGVRKASVELSEKVLTTAERVRDTLIHELCHAAAWLLDGFLGHGKIWKIWTEKATKCLPELPEITQCHDYDIDYKFTYKCSICGLKSQAHTKSKKVDKALCAKCHGPIEVFSNQKDKDGKITLVALKEACGFAKFVKENYKMSKEAGGTHANIMKILSNNFAKLSVDEKVKYKN